MNAHLQKRNKRYHINTQTESFNSTLKGLTVIELCICELCTRACSFCPRADPKVYDNRKLFMSFETIRKFVIECIRSRYSGDIHISGFGEPTLHPELGKFIILIKSLLPSNWLVITTNGDTLKSDTIKMFFGYGLNYLIISCYDGPDRKAEIHKLLTDCHIKEDQFEIRELWLKDQENVGTFAKRNNFNNRSGAANVSISPVDGSCYLPFYKLVLDWDGIALLCCNDWLRRHKSILNINKDTLSNIWYSKFFSQVRDDLFNKKRTNEACKRCSIEGTLIGVESVKALRPSQ